MKGTASRPVLAATLFAAIGSLAIGNASFAAGTEPAGSGAQRSVAVRYGDLDLNRTEGIEVLYGRLRFAARRVCGTADSRDQARSRVINQCYREALDRAVVQIDRAELAALHQGSGRHLAAAPPRIVARQ